MTSPSSMPPGSPPGRGGMPKWLIIVAVLLLFVVVGCCGGVTACWLVARHAAHAAVSMSPIQFDEKGGLTVHGSQGDMNIGGKSLPASFPTDVAVYPGLTPESSLSAGKGGTVTFTGKGTPSDVADWYQKQMQDQGWTQAGSESMGEGQIQTYKKAGREASLMITPSGNGQVTVLTTYKAADAGDTGTDTGGDKSGAAAPGAPGGAGGTGGTAAETPAAPVSPERTPEQAAVVKAMKLPSNFPTNVPVYSGMTSTFSGSDNLKGQGTVLLQGKVAHQDVVDYYTKQLKDGGWEQTANTEVGEVTHLEYTKDDQNLVVQVSPGDNDMTLLMIGYSKK